jgi:hypothetical protein
MTAKGGLGFWEREEAVKQTQVLQERKVEEENCHTVATMPVRFNGIYFWYVLQN